MPNCNTLKTADVFTLGYSISPGCKESYLKHPLLHVQLLIQMRIFFFASYFATNHFRNKLDTEADLIAFIHLTSFGGIKIALL